MSKEKAIELVRKKYKFDKIIRCYVVNNGELVVLRVETKEKEMTFHVYDNGTIKVFVDE